jgi:hypothetical protein
MPDCRRPWWRRRECIYWPAGSCFWGERLRRNLALNNRLVACRRDRHRGAYLLADHLVGSPLGDDYPELAVCEVLRALP